MDPVSCRENVHARKWHSQETIRLNICKRKRKMHLDMENFRMETQRKMKDFSAKERGNLAVEREFKRQSLNAVPCGANGHASKKPSPQGPSSTNCKRKCEMNVDMMVGMWYLHLKSGKGVLYEESEQSSSDSELKLICFPCSIYDWQMRDEDWRDNGVSGKFREELTKILEKPYNEREYGDLWQM
ncbi:hypothetical protein NC653_014237 [Populus alba x Populus x berolinensis]|uniref:Uncharacterized protein n=1 Tax=Populus alba x Populus x berolinensis TaxID=444605 RepID=A0AAD6QWT3_9ROSI|nr:hypothetical protein NC653_014237 [Populus alba x Populus x berolinensis]